MWLDRVMRLMGFIACLSVVLMVVLIPVDVSRRYLGFGGLRFTLDLIEYCVMISAFAAAPWVLHVNGHVSVDMLVGALPEKARKTGEVIVNLLGLLTSATILFATASRGFKSWEQGRQIAKSFAFPEWVLFAFFGLAFLLIAVEFLFRLTRAVSALSGSDKGWGRPWIG